LGVALPLIELDKVTVSFHGEKILDSVSLSVHAGESIAIIGPSGKGKTVLLKVIAGLISPTSGEVRILGKSWSKMPPIEKRNVLAKMGMLFQKNALFDSLTVGENIAFPMRENTRLSEEEIQQIVVRFLEAVGIPHARDLFPDEISGGMQKRLGIARALALDPEIIFYDDPTAGLDPITSRKIIDLILDLKAKRGATILAITNDMNRAYQLAQRIWMVVDHTVLDTGSVAETQNSNDPRVRQFTRGLLQGPLTVVE
jgi:phospholipid/cholesterol/gamma-HCH transport system ATP-binding protein